MKKDGKKCLGILSNIMKWQMLVMSIAIMMTASACSDDDETTPEENSEQVQNSPEEEQTTVTQTPNGAAMITDKEKLAMLRSMKDLEGDKGRIYEIKYTADYKLDEALEFGISSTNSLKMFVAQYLLDVVPSTKTLKLSYDAGCSAFACPDNAQGEYLMGRNFDFNHLDADTKERIMIPVIAVHTAPEGGKKSVSFVDGQFLDYKSGFYTDGISDLSMLMALPYVILDGINEDGFAISVLKLDGLYAEQNESGKKKIFTTVALRMLLDKAGSVKEAIELLKNYNISMDKVAASYHFFMADAKGDYAIVEYTNPDTSLNPDCMEVLSGDDCYRYVTNFYVSPSMKDTEHGINQSEHGKARYNILKEYLSDCGYNLNAEQGMKLLTNVAQGPESELTTGFTQWSEMYNLSKKKVTMSILREWDKTFTFNIE